MGKLVTCHGTCVGYASVHWGLTASRVRSRAHLLKTGRKMTGLKVSECLSVDTEALKKCKCGLHAGVVQSLL